MTISEKSPGEETATPRVGVVVLTWNSKVLTLDCLESLAGLSYTNADIIVVDNHSNDGSAEAIEEVYGPRVAVIRNDDNLGFSRGNNIGIQHALDRGAQFVLLLNNDTTVDPGLVDALLSVFTGHAPTGIVGPKIYYASPQDQIWYAGGEVLFARGAARHIGIRQRDVGQFDSVSSTDYVTGCALMARRDVFEKIGYLDPSYKAYFEDADFCMRAKQAGFDIRYTPSGKVWHKISSSTGGQLSRRKVSLKLQSTWRFFARYASPHHWLTIPVFFLFDVLRIVTLVALGRIRDTADADNAPSTK